MTDNEKAPRTSMGGQPYKKKYRPVDVEVPIGLEKLLYLAARDSELRAELLSNRKAVVERLGLRLKPSEAAMLDTVSDMALEGMIDQIQPENPWRRKVMNVVAATGLAATAAMLSGPSCAETGGHGPDVDVDGDTDSDSDGDTDSDGDSDGDTTQ